MLAEIWSLFRKPSDWFLIEKIRQSDREVEIAANIMKGKPNQLLYKKLEEWAARLLEKEVRLFEEKLWELCAENSATPSVDDDNVLVEHLREYINESAHELKQTISDFCRYNPDEWSGMRSTLQNASELTGEMSNTIPLAGEIARLEMLDSGQDTVDKLSHSQIRIERFLLKTYSVIPHPFSDVEPLSLSQDNLDEAIRLTTYVVFTKVEEPRLNGFEGKFVNVFLRYLSSSRELSSTIVEQVAALFEPFLKKLSFLFDWKHANGKPLWNYSLEPLVVGLNLSEADLKKSDKAYWQGRSVQDGTLRLAFQLRHKSAHEAHRHLYYEAERYAYFVFAALVISCHRVLQANPKIREAVTHQAAVDSIRDLFVRIEDLKAGPDGPRLLSSTPHVPATRLEKLLALTARAQTIWPNCSPLLFQCLESEYHSVQWRLIERDREADLEAYFDSMRPDEY